MQRVLLLDIDVIDNSHSDLDDMNEGKEAVAYRYSDSFICSTQKNHIDMPDEIIVILAPTLTVQNLV